MKSGDKVATGVGLNRRRLTLDEAYTGCLPEPFTKEEWHHMYMAILQYAKEIHERHHQQDASTK